VFDGPGLFYRPVPNQDPSRALDLRPVLRRYGICRLNRKGDKRIILAAPMDDGW
jgi:hypothetical protein